MKLMKEQLNQFINLALQEDIQDGDHTSLACINPESIGKAELLIKENGVLAGVELAHFILEKTNRNIKINNFLTDGSIVKRGDIAFTVEGSSITLLSVERLILNCMQRMSGIATKTHKLNQLLTGTEAKLLDTRKTTPGFRLIEKWAVRIGGGTNHRFGLYDMMMIKDNHIDFAGGIKEAINKAHNYQKKQNLNLDIIIEARNIQEVNAIMNIGKIKRILLDNFNFEDTQKAVSLINHQFEIETSGNITEKNIRQYAECGVDYISTGSITHSANILDLSFKAIN